MFEMSMAPEMGMRVTPALLNLAHLLTLPTMALHQAVQQELTENPALEELDLDDLSQDVEQALNDAYMEEMYESSNGERPMQRADEEFDSLLFVAAPRSLTEILLADLHASLPEHDHGIALALVGNLDDQGFLPDSPDDIAITLNVAPKRVWAVLDKLREVGPPGIATCDTRECLLAQLDALAEQGVTNPHVRTIIDTFFDDLGAHRYTHIARQLQINTDQVKVVRDFIQDHLWPYPVQAAMASPTEPERVRYRRPDMAIHHDQEEDTFVVEVLHSPRRTLRLSPLYRDLARQTASLDDSEREHVQEYVARARTFLANLRQRESTLQRIGETIIVRQEAFLRHGVRHVVPMTRTEIAAELGLHESTVSRATAEKVALLPNKQSMPLSEFFVAARGVQDVLRELVQHETSPLSDAELARILSEQGYSIARRTVAKYREQMQIPPSHLR